MQRKKFIWALLVSAFFLATSNISSAAETIEWELRYPYRQFEQRSKNEAKRYFKPEFVEYVRRSWDYRRKLFYHESCRDDIQPILCSERKLNSQREKMRAEMMKLPTNPNAYGADGSSRWTAEAFYTKGNKYLSGQLRYQREMVHHGSNEKHAVRLRLKLPQYRTKQCLWNIDGTTSEILCDQPAYFGFLRGQKSSKVSVNVVGTNASFTIGGDSTFVREVLIAGIGDSYASGEGVPDVPARIKHSDGKPVIKKNIPVRLLAKGSKNADWINAAYWAERNCHRSFLSSQARAAIHYAAMHPKTETTFLHVACSGAEVDEGVLNTYSGAYESNRDKRKLEREGNGEVWRTNMSQLNQLIALLCVDPKIDDHVSKFKKWFNKRHGFFRNRSEKREFVKNVGRIASTFLDEPFDEVIECHGGFKRNIDALMLGISGNDFGFFSVVRRSLQPPAVHYGTISPEAAGDNIRKNAAKLLTKMGIKLEEHLKISSPQKIVLSAYPLALTNEKNEWCNTGEGLNAFDLPVFSNPLITANESRDTHDLFGVPLNNALESHAMLSNWRFSKSHVKQFDSRGWCAKNARWLRTPNDGALVQNYLPSSKEKERSGLFGLFNKMLITYGLMHPNEHGAAAMADSYYSKLKKILE